MACAEREFLLRRLVWAGWWVVGGGRWLVAGGWCLRVGVAGLGVVGETGGRGFLVGGIGVHSGANKRSVFWRACLCGSVDRLAITIQ